MKKQIKVQITYNQKLCGQIDSFSFTYCSLLDRTDNEKPYCIPYQKYLGINKDYIPYRCAQCKRRNK